MFKPLLAAAFVTFSAGCTLAQDVVTLRFHQFLPTGSNVPTNILRPWGAEVEAASGGRIKIEFYDQMALGGKPTDLYDQAKDGVVDLVLTLPGYTPGRFPRSEVFELPFIMKDPVATSRAYMQMITEDFANNEYADVHVIGGYVHGPGVVHTDTPVLKLEDMAGKQLRAPTRLAGELLAALGATAVGLPLPAVPENLSKGVINGALIPWDASSSVKLSELVHNHAELSGTEAIYTATIIVVMNKASYDNLPDDLKAALDSKSGDYFSAFAGRVESEADAPIRQAAIDMGNVVTVLDATESARWKAAAAPVQVKWLADMSGQGIDGAALLARAKELMAQFGG